MDAPRDQNYVPVGLATDSTDGTVVLPIKIDPITGYLLAEIS
jgi:hypothetical protein